MANRPKPYFVGVAFKSYSGKWRTQYPYTYRTTLKLAVGDIVRVPVGTNGEVKEAIVVDLHGEVKLDYVDQIKDILEVIGSE